MFFKLLVFIVVPSFIVYVFWVTYKLFNRRAPEENSKEEIENINNPKNDKYV